MIKTLIFAWPLLFIANAETNSNGAWEVSGGAASFIATTNVSAVTVHGKTDQLTAHIRMRVDPQELMIESVQATVNPSNLSTGMGVRDQHMREKILKAPDGSLPELRFVAENTRCPAPTNGKQTTCDLAGTFFLRGQGQPFRMQLKVKSDGKQDTAYRVAGEGILQLTRYGLEPPSQFGVRVADNVKVTVDFVAKEPAVGARR